MTDETLSHGRKLSTADIKSREQFSFYCEMICENFFHVDVNRRSRGPFDGSISIHKMGAVAFNRVKADAHIAKLTKLGVSRFDSHCYKFHIQNTSIVKIKQHGQEYVLKPGDALLIDCFYPFQLDFPELSDSFSVKIPRNLLRPLLNDPKTASNTPIPASSSLGMAIKHYIRFLISQSGTMLSEKEVRLYQDSLLGLIVSAVSTSASGWEEYYRETMTDKTTRIKDHILENLNDPELSPARVAQHFSISVSYLHKLFSKNEKSFGHYIRDQRLDTAAKYLQNPIANENSTTITALAYHLGFNDLSHFWRLFRERFGMTPRAYLQTFKKQNIQPN